jgi:predicted RNA-binding protein with RPS1 domain
MTDRIDDPRDLQADTVESANPSVDHDGQAHESGAAAEDRAETVSTEGKASEGNSAVDAQRFLPEHAGADAGSSVPAAPAELAAPESVTEPTVPEPESPAETQPESATVAEAGSADAPESAPAAAVPQPTSTETEAGSVPPPAVPKPPRVERPEVQALRRALEAKEPVEGKVIGWNKGGLHVVIGGVTAFCPRSEVEVGAPQDPQSYVDRTFPFLVMKVQKRGRRVVVSRRALAEREQHDRISELRDCMRRGEVLEGKVSSITDFGAFVDIDGVDGLVHVSEISRARLEHPSEKLSVGDEVRVKILKIADGGKRVSLSIKALEDDPWDDVEKRLPVGEIVPGVVERTAEFGAFVEVAPGITGLLPTSAMNIPRDASPARVYHPGREVAVQIVAIDKRRRRVSLALEGSRTEGTNADLKSYLERQKSSAAGFGTLAAAFGKARREED